MGDEEVIETFDEEEGARFNAPSLLDRMEKVYLAATRILALTGATLLLLWAGWYIVSGLYKVSRSAASVKEVPAAVSATDLVAVETRKSPGASTSGSKTADARTAAERYYKDFVTKYYAVFNSKFAPFQKAGDQKWTRDAFDKRFVQSSDRIEEAAKGSLISETDRADLDALLAAMSQAASAKETTDRLTTYKKTTPKQVTRTIRNVRSETYCKEWGYYIDMCISYGTREVPVVRRVTESQLPDGVISPADLFAAYQDRFFSLLGERREQSAGDARNERASIEEGNIVGAGRLWMAVYIVGGFVCLMFLFLLIAIERHQRQIARGLPPASAV